MENTFKGINVSLANIIWVIGVIFMSGIAYSEIKYLSNKLDEQEIIFNERITIIHRRLEKKISQLEDAEEKIQTLEVEVAKLNTCK